MFCLPHRVSLVLAVEGIPVHWESIRIPNPSGSCPFCRAMKEGAATFERAKEKWVQAAKMDPKILSDSPKVSGNSSDKEKTMDYSTQKHNRDKLREENNRKIVRDLKGNSKPDNNKRVTNKPTKKPNHLRLV